MANRYQVHTEDQILELLGEGPSTINILADRTNQSYYTIRRTVYSLQDKHLVKLHGFKNKSQVFALDHESINKHTIPMIDNIVLSVSNKAYFLIEGVGKENTMLGLQAVKNLPNFMTRLMMIAHKLNATRDRGKLPVSGELGLLREEMRLSYIQSKNITNIYKQILDHPHFWSEDFLERMATDIDFSEREVVTAYNYYYNKETEELGDDD